MSTAYPLGLITESTINKLKEDDYQPSSLLTRTFNSKLGWNLPSCSRIHKKSISLGKLKEAFVKGSLILIQRKR